MLLKRRREGRGDAHGIAAAYCPRSEEEEAAGSKHLSENDFGEKGILF